MPEFSSDEVKGFQNAVRWLAQYRAAAWLYHHGPPGVESPWSDDMFDQMERALGMPKELGHTIQLTEDEQRRAIQWSLNVSFDQVGEKSEG